MSWMQGLSSRALVGAAVVGIVGAAGIFIYEQMYAEKRRAMLAQEVGRLDRQVASMREELHTLRQLHKESETQRPRRRPRPRPAPPLPSHNTVTSDSEYFTDYASVCSEGGDSEAEFYDVHSDSESESVQERRPDGRESV